MSDQATTRIDPPMNPVASPGPVAAPASPPAPPAAPDMAAPRSSPTTTATSAGGISASDQLSRVEDKAARIEEKFARIENLMQRVEHAALNLEDVARRTDVERLSDRVSRLPGFGALIAAGFVSAFVTAAIIIAVMRYAPALLPQ